MNHLKSQIKLVKQLTISSFKLKNEGTYLGILWYLIDPLVLFFILGLVPLFGLDPQYQFRFEQLALILGAKFGSIISLGLIISAYFFFESHKHINEIQNKAGRIAGLFSPLVDGVLAVAIV